MLPCSWQRATLLLTACGGGDEGSKADDEIVCADATGGTASPSTSTADAAPRPKAALPSDVTNVFEGWKTGDCALTAQAQYFNPRVNVYATGKATLTYCPFEGNAFVKEKQSGKAEKTPVTDRPYLNIQSTTAEPVPLKLESGAEEARTYLSARECAINDDGWVGDGTFNLQATVTWTGIGGADQAVTVQGIQALNH
ncbi:hypothetical protein [Streptomyces sp. NPDC008137]|uniref:hypothetical protein n=1 Tax=Streptomyces sp. NPDC008137 TaxID=3364813 RepID=UPI0036E27702